MVKMNKEKRGSSDVVTDVSLNITGVRWKHNNVVNAIFAFTIRQPIQLVKRYCHREKRRVKIERSNIIHNSNIISQYNMSMMGVDCMHENISVYMFNVGAKRCWWPLFRFLVNVAVNNTYQIYCQSHLNHGAYRLDTLRFH